MDVYIGDYQIVKDGMDAGYSEEAASQKLSAEEVQIRIDLQAGSVSATFWTCDYSYDYIRINADYRT